MRLTIDTGAIAHTIRRAWFRWFQQPRPGAACMDCGATLTATERTYYGVTCERCEGIRYAELERAHFGDPDKETGIYAPRNAGARASLPPCSCVVGAGVYCYLHGGTFMGVDTAGLPWWRVSPGIFRRSEAQVDLDALGHLAAVAPFTPPADVGPQPPVTRWLKETWR
jgi:hypothetical protein